MRHTGLAALLHVESSHTEDRTRVPYVGTWILIHRTTREVHPFLSFFLNHFLQESIERGCLSLGSLETHSE